MPNLHICETCGKRYEAHRSFSRYCSDVCRAAANRAKKNDRHTTAVELLQRMTSIHPSGDEVLYDAARRDALRFLSEESPRRRSR